MNGKLLKSVYVVKNAGIQVMATPQQKTTYSATEVAALEETILKLKLEDRSI